MDSTPLFDDMIQKYGATTAMVYGAVWRVCQEYGECNKSHAGIGKIVGLTGRAVFNHIKKLVADGHLTERSGGEKKPNIYCLTYERRSYVDSQHMNDVPQTYERRSEDSSRSYERDSDSKYTTTTTDGDAQNKKDKRQFGEMMELYHNNVVISESPTTLEQIQMTWEEIRPPPNETKFDWFEYAIGEACASGPRGRNWRLIRSIINDISAAETLAEHKQLRQEAKQRNGTHPPSRKKKRYDIVEVSNG